MRKWLTDGKSLCGAHAIKRSPKQIAARMPSRRFVEGSTGGRMLSPLVASDDDDDAFGRGVVGGELGLVTERRVLAGGCTRSWRGVNERVRLTPEAWPSDCIRSRTLTGRAGDVLVSFTTTTSTTFVAVAGFGGDFFVGDGDLRSLAHARSVASCSSMLRIRSVKGKGLVTESGEARAELLVEASEEVSGLLPSASIGKGVGMSAAPTLISKRHGTSGSAFGVRASAYARRSS